MNVPWDSELGRAIARQAGVTRPSPLTGEGRFPPTVGGGNARNRGRVSVLTSRPLAFELTLTLPCRVVSEANRRGHWSHADRRRKEQAACLRAALAAVGLLAPPPLPCAVVLTHVGRAMDGDNLQRAFKGLRDTVAAFLACDDADPRVGWEYRQERGTPGVVLTLRAGHTGRATT